jgi:hypothetical protein
MNTVKTAVHFTDNYLISPTNPIEVNLIGAGGTGSKVLTALMEMNHSLTELGHAGLQVRLWDDDIITKPIWADSVLQKVKQDCTNRLHLINRVNRLWVQIGKPKPKV